MSLEERVAHPGDRKVIAEAGVAAIAEHVGSLGGLKGSAIKAGYATISKAKPNLVRNNLMVMLPKMAPKIDPHYDAAVASGDVDGYFALRADVVANDLLEVTDERAAEANNATAVKVYNKLRPSAQAQVVEAMPTIVKFIQDNN